MPILAGGVRWWVFLPRAFQEREARLVQQSQQPLGRALKSSFRRRQLSLFILDAMERAGAGNQVPL
jgi:chorismate-pyruvate lyase